MTGFFYVNGGSISIGLSCVDKGILTVKGFVACTYYSCCCTFVMRCSKRKLEPQTRGVWLLLHQNKPCLYKLCECPTSLNSTHASGHTFLCKSVEFHPIPTLVYSLIFNLKIARPLNIIHTKMLKIVGLLLYSDSFFSGFWRSILYAWGFQFGPYFPLLAAFFQPD